MMTMAAGVLQAGRVRDVMRMQVVTVVPEMTVRELAETLAESGVRCAPVLGPAGKVVGIASQADVARLAFERPAGAGGRGALRVRDLMAPVGDTAAPDEPLSALVRRFLRAGGGQVLVVDHGLLLGVVTPMDVLGAIDGAL